MYSIIGADGREYGPVSAEQLSRWISEGRLNAQTPARSEGSAEWRPLATFPEFANALGLPAGGPVEPPSLPQSSEAVAADILARDYNLDIGSCLRRSWELLKRHFWIVVATTFLVYVLLAGVSALLSNLATVASQIRGDRFPIEAVLISSLWGFIFGGALLGGLYWFFLRLIRGHSPGVEEAFAGFKLAYGQLTLAYIVSALLIYLGLIFCIIPGIYLGVAWIFALPLVIDKRMRFWDAMELSRKVVTRHWWSVFALCLVSGIIGAAGVLACCIGIFVTGPIGFGALVYAYEDIFGPQAAGAIRI